MVWRGLPTYHRGSVHLQAAVHLSAIASCPPSSEWQCKACSAQPSCGFEVKSSRKETQLTIPCNQHQHEIWWGARNLQRQRAGSTNTALHVLCEELIYFQLLCWQSIVFVFFFYCGGVIDIHLPLGWEWLGVLTSWLCVTDWILIIDGV